MHHQSGRYQLASTALSRAEAFSDHQPPYEAVGISLAAALPTTRQRKGSDRIHVSLHTQSRRLFWSVELSKDAFDREMAESIADEMIFIALSELCCQRDESATQHHAGQRLCGLELIRKEDGF